MAASETTPVADYLFTHGPAPRRDLPTKKLSLEDRVVGVWRFRGDWAYAGETPGGQTLCVYYLHEFHEPEAVVRAWFETNPHAAQNCSRSSLRRVLGRNGKQFHDAIHTVYTELTE